MIAIAVEHQVEIQRARRALERALAAAFALDGQQASRARGQTARVEPAAAPFRKTRLRADAHRVGVDEAWSRRRSGEERTQAFEREREVGCAIAQVAAEGNRDGDTASVAEPA